MTWIEIKYLRTLMKVIENKRAIEQTIYKFNEQYFFRTTLKASDYQALPSIA